MERVLVLNGPNLNLLGTREPDVYGRDTFDDLTAMCVSYGHALGLNVSVVQSNNEGTLIDQIHDAGRSNIPIIFNPAAYTHTSVALRDAITASGANVIEVHISNVFAREEFRHYSHISPVARGSIVGFGFEGYKLALQALASSMENNKKSN